MKTTVNYGLKKPDGTDVVNVDDFNYNSDIIDQKLKEVDTKASNITVPVTSVNGKTGAVILSAGDIKAADGKTLEAYKTEVTSELAQTTTILTPTGTANAIILPVTLQDKKKYSFKATANSTGAVTINGKPFKKLDGTTISNVKINKVYDFYYDATANSVFILAKAEGNALVGDVLAGRTFTNMDDIGLVGAIPRVTPTLVDSIAGNPLVYSGWGDGKRYALLSVPNKSYLDGIGWIRSEQPDIIPTNIVKGKAILGVIGTYDKTLGVGDWVSSGDIDFDLSKPWSVYLDNMPIFVLAGDDGITYTHNTTPSRIRGYKDDGTYWQSGEPCDQMVLHPDGIIIRSENTVKKINNQGLVQWMYTLDSYASGLTVANNGDIYVRDSLGKKVVKLDTNGVEKWIYVDYYNGVDISNSATVYVDNNNDAIITYASAYRVVKMPKAGGNPIWVHLSSNFGASNVAFDSNNNIFYSNYSSSDIVKKLNSQGVEQKTLSNTMSRIITGISVASDNRVIINAESGTLIRICDNDLIPIDAWNTTYNYSALRFKNNKIFIYYNTSSSSQSNRLLECRNLKGDLMWSRLMFSTSGSTPIRPYAFGVDSKDRVSIGAQNNFQVMRLIPRYKITK